MNSLLASRCHRHLSNNMEVLSLGLTPWGNARFGGRPGVMACWCVVSDQGGWSRALGGVLASRQPPRKNRACGILILLGSARSSWVLVCLWSRRGVYVVLAVYCRGGQQPLSRKTPLSLSVFIDFSRIVLGGKSSGQPQGWCSCIVLQPYSWLLLLSLVTSRKARVS